MTAAVQPERLLERLHELWTSLGAAESGEAGGVLRACAMTLIVIAEENEDADAIGETLAQVMREHPSRAVVVRVLPESHAPLEARVFAQCWLPFGRGKQICCEQIEIKAGETRLPEVAPVLVPLAAPDLPVVVWLRSPGLLRAAGVQNIAAAADRVILDSSAFGSPLTVLQQAAAGACGRRPVADLAWTRLTRWRETIAQIFECPEAQARRREISEVRVSHTGAALPISVCYLAGWLAGALGWKPGDARLVLDAAGRDAPAALDGVTLSAPGLEIRIHRGDGQGLDARINGLPHRAAFPELDEAALLGEELSITGRDAIYEQVLAAAIEIAKGTR